MIMKKFLFFSLAILLFLPLVAIAEDEPVTRTYYQTTPSQTLPAGSLWNPLVTEKSYGTTYKSYYRLPDNKVTPQGSIWNPLASTKEKGGKDKK
jgi:hypothetical protein